LSPDKLILTSIPAVYGRQGMRVVCPRFQAEFTSWQTATRKLCETASMTKFASRSAVRV